MKILTMTLLITPSVFNLHGILLLKKYKKYIIHEEIQEIPNPRNKYLAELCTRSIYSKYSQVFPKITSTNHSIITSQIKQ